MAKYQFKVYLQDGETKKIVPMSMKQTDLSDMDKFVSQYQNSFDFYQALASELQISSNQIKKVTILRIKKEIEFSVIINNTYLQPVLSSLQIKKIRGYGNYFIDATVIPMNHPNYLEMQKYLLENVQGDSKFFLTNIYTYDNEFAKLLHRYGNSFNQGLYQEEDLRNIKELEDKIEIELSIYKNYRGLCLARKKYEDRLAYNVSIKRNAKVQNLNTSQYMNNFSNYTLKKEFRSREEQTEEYNREYDEYLEPDEYAMMQDEHDDYKGY